MLRRVRGPFMLSTTQRGASRGWARRTMVEPGSPVLVALSVLTVPAPAGLNRGATQAKPGSRSRGRGGAGGRGSGGELGAGALAR